MGQVSLPLDLEIQQPPPVREMEFAVFHLFCGSGGGALGFQQAVTDWRGIRGRFRTLGGVDVDPEACADFEALTGVRATCMDLFSRDDYRAFHGHEPPESWREATPEDLRAAAGGERPDVIFSSPPCKGFSALLPKAWAQSARYQALNRLTLRGLWLALEAWADDPPGLIILENVPRITSRGRGLLDTLKALLAAYGYAVQDGYHDVGEVGGLAQRRRRYLLVARHRQKVPAFLYRPPRRRVRAIGEVLEHLPLPDDETAGPMHRLPRLAWRTWVRLALIPAGGDWRDLQHIQPGDYVIQPHMGVDPSSTLTGSRLGSGAPAVADPRLDYKPRKGAYRVGRWERPASTVIGSASPRGSNGMGAVADPRLGCRPRNGAYRVVAWDEPAPTVTGAGDVHSQGAACVADPRIPEPDEHGVWLIVAEDGTWHRPLTTLELAVLQGFPARLSDGRPLVLAGKSQARWRERIGNAVPPPAAQAIGEMMLLALIPAALGQVILSPLGTALWVRALVRRLLSRIRAEAR